MSAAPPVCEHTAQAPRFQAPSPPPSGPDRALIEGCGLPAAHIALYGGPASSTAPARTSFALDLGRNLRALGPPDRWLHGDALTVTLVAVPLRRGETIDDLAVPFERVRLSVQPGAGR
jgi:hypothetical protein